VPEDKVVRQPLTVFQVEPRGYRSTLAAVSGSLSNAMVVVLGVLVVQGMTPQEMTALVA